MTRFRQALLDELQSRISDSQPVPRTARLTRPRLAFGGAAVAAATAVVVATQAGGTPAYAVTTEPDGTVSVTVNRVDDPAPANRALRAAGDRVVIMRPSAEKDCLVRDRGTVLPVRLIDAFKASQALEESGEENVVRVRPKYIPADAVLVLVPVTGRDGEDARILVNWYAAPGPKCVIDPFPS